jgi:hypothetical protein
MPDPLFDQELKKTNPHLLSLFVGKEEYLEEVVQSKKRYLGKYVTQPSLDHMIDLEKHLLSLLNKLAPRYTFEKNPPVLVVIHGSADCYRS